MNIGSHSSFILSFFIKSMKLSVRDKSVGFLNSTLCINIFLTFLIKEDQVNCRSKSKRKIFQVKICLLTFLKLGWFFLYFTFLFNSNTTFLKILTIVSNHPVTDSVCWSSMMFLRKSLVAILPIHVFHL